MLFSSYQRDDFADPDSFVMQLGLILERYSDAVIEAVTSPLTGLQRHRTAPPTLAHVVEACEAESIRIERLKALAALKLQPSEPRAPQHRANVFILPEAPQYAAMVEKAKTGDAREWRWDEHRAGIWVALGWLEDAPAASATWRQYTGSELEALYGPQAGAEQAAE